MAADETMRMESGASAASGHVIVIGASAGALGALRTMLGGISAGCGATFIVAVHRSSSLGGSFADLLQPYTELAVREAHAGAPLEPNTVLVLPAAGDLDALDSHLHLVPAPQDGAARARIDRAFRVAAAACGGRSVGVLLTGAGSDGSLGLGQIKCRGGLTIAQDPDEAEHAGMPRSAIENGVVDLVLPLREIPAAIARYCATEPRLPFEARLEGDNEDSAALAELLELLARHTGRDFGVYRRSLLERRVGKRMRLRGLESWPKYVERVRRDAAEATALAHELLMNVADFFDDGKAFERLEAELLPRLFDSKTGDRDAVRAWVVGCATGEGAYSLAIALLEERARRDVKPRIQIFASDVGDEAIRRARLGVYPAEIESSVSAERLSAFFVPEDGTYRVRSELRDVVVFASHDVVKDFPFSHVDLVVCRGALLDHLKPEIRRDVLRSFHYALRPQGALVVDPRSSAVSAESQLFDPLGDGVFRPSQAAGRLEPRANLSARVLASGIGDAAGSVALPQGQPGLPNARVLHLALLERYTPASVLVDTAGSVLHYSARAARFLRMPGGEVTHELVRLLHEPLRSAVRGGLEAVERSSSAWTSDALLVHSENGLRRVSVHVDSAVEPLSLGLKLVVFEEVGPGDTVRDDYQALTAADFTSRLGAELEHASRRLRAVVSRENGGAQNDADRQPELPVALAELEAAKEELRSVNQELLTLDRDNRARLEELARLTGDLEVLLESTGLATLFVDRALDIVRFTTPLLDVFHVVPGDHGKPLAEVQHRLGDVDLLDDARTVLRHLAPVEREVPADNGKWYLMRMMPYRSAPHGIGGVAITLVDVTSRKKAELELREADRRKDEFIALLAHELRNPLAPITSGIEILKRRDLDPVLAERVTQTMARQASQLVRLIDDLLDVSRISSGRLQLRKQRVALADVIRDAVAAVRPMIERSNHRLTLDTPPEPILLDADAARLTQVLANLLNNAARYTPVGGEIEVAVRRDDAEAVVSVTDNGFGIPDDTLPHVFEMFYQGSDQRTATQTGLGIGLALAKSLVDMHGGSISAESAGVDRGSRFTMRLPVLAQSGAETSRAHAGAGTSLGGHRVLVVDDNADAAETLAMLIRALGENDVHVALSGEEALPIAERVKPDTVFLDLKMPDMDGYEVAQRLRRAPWCQDTWLVALTGCGLDEHKRRSKSSGFDQHLTKPADRAELEAILSRPATAARRWDTRASSTPAAAEAPRSEQR